MLSFLRARIPRSSQPRPRLRDAKWDGRVLTLLLDDVASGENIALDIDGCFFADARVSGQGMVSFEFAFALQENPILRVLPRLHRDGEPLASAPVPIRFGMPGIVSSDIAIATPDDLGSIGRLVPFGTDCAAHEVAIVIPVYDAPSIVVRCLDSVIEHTTGRARLIVIDDASPDLAIAPLLERYSSRTNVSVLRNPRNRGFTATANRGIVEAGRADVVLLNADTEVGPNWLAGLRRAAACANDVATVTAVSDNAGAFSVPELERENMPPAEWTFEQAARALWHNAGRAYPELPTGNGFCMYIRRAVIDAVGMLDEAAFPQGYGEENDFCQRASARGMRHLIAGNVYVRHARSASFGHERRAALGKTGMAVLRERWPNYEADVAASLFSFERRVLDWRVRRVFAMAREMNPRMRVLIVGDVEITDIEAWRLVVRGGRIVLRRDGKTIASCASRNDAESVASVSHDEKLWIWLQVYAIEAVIAADEFPDALPRFAALLGIPFVQSGVNARLPSPQPSPASGRGGQSESALASTSALESTSVLAQTLAAARSFPEPSR
jgi:GT2 family glycosyltransferase